jgi:transcriptional regulator with XRE-family HTH domain
VALASVNLKQFSNFKKLRTLAGYDQIQLARAVRTSQPVISRIENGKLTPDIVLAEQIARILGVNALLLFPQLKDYTSNLEGTEVNPCAP